MSDLTHFPHTLVCICVVNVRWSFKPWWHIFCTLKIVTYVTQSNGSSNILIKHDIQGPILRTERRKGSQPLSCNMPCFITSMIPVPSYPNTSIHDLNKTSIIGRLLLVDEGWLYCLFWYFITYTVHWVWEVSKWPSPFNLVINVPPFYILWHGSILINLSKIKSLIL